MKALIQSTTARSTTGARTLEERFLNAVFGKRPSELEITQKVERGFPIKSVDFLRGEGVTFTEVHEVVLPARTLKHRKDKRQALSAEESDRTLRLARILTLADHVFGNHEKALSWLRGENRLLGSRTPIKMLRSETGGDLVRQMLYQIDEGIYV
ncbi:MAG TPA: antitoxin Xre/MbcA/ParS toxin-binding domain-containing protein [Bryobacteraceae bacterium]